MRSWGVVWSSLFALAVVLAGVACGRTGLDVQGDVSPTVSAGDGGTDSLDAGRDSEGGVLPTSLDAAIIKVGDAEVANDQQIATGEAHACLRTTKGDVFCWGANELGQLGDGTKTHRATAAKVAGLPAIVRVAAGTHHTCALAVDESVWCWGGNSQGEQGQGTMGGDPVLAPTKVQLPGVIGITAGGYHTCAHDAQGHSYCWGRNIYGECGAQGAAYVVTPKPVPSLGNVLEISAGWDHTCAIMSDRTVRCFGRNQDGQIGNGTSGSTEINPQVAIGVTGARALFAGDDHTCAILLDGTMQCWGDNENGELGAGAALYADKALRCVGMTDAYQGGGGREHSCVATGGGTVFCWGANTGCGIGIGQPCGIGVGIVKVPTQVANISDARWVATGEVFSCAAHRVKGAMCWGQNDRGQLGGGDMNDFGDHPGVATEVLGL